MSRNKVEKNIAYDDVKGLYYVTLYFGTGETGKPIKKTVTTTSKKEAQRTLREHNRQKEAGTAVPPAKDTLAEYTKDYINFKATILEETTIHGYNNIYKNHIVPFFGKKPIQEVTAKDLQDYISYKSSTGLSMNSIKKHMTLLYSIFQNAYKNRVINENPVTRMDRIKTKKPEILCMDAGEIRELCQSVKGTSLEVPVMLGVYLGLRRGEVAGLKWENIDFEKSILDIKNTRTKVGNKIVEKAPKTDHSTRQLMIPAELVQILKEHKRKQQKIMNAQGLKHDYVVTGITGSPTNPNYIMSPQYSCRDRILVIVELFHFVAGCCLPFPGRLIPFFSQ